MRVYFYHTQDIAAIRDQMARGEFPSHFLYGATRLERHGIDVVWHRTPMGLPRWRMMIVNAWRVLRSLRHFDAIYATHYRGLELVVLLRALGLLRKPIIVWHHQPVVRSRSALRELLGRLFYRGFDRMIFFSQKLIDDSVGIGKASPDRMVLGHWGADLEFYDRVMEADRCRSGFISTGKELRDMPTLIAAFNAEGLPLRIFTGRKTGGVDYERVIDSCHPKDNIGVNYVEGLCPAALSREVDGASCVVICCQPTRYTVGLTTVVEALAMGLPVVCSRNPQIPVDFDGWRCGLTVAYGDVDGWRTAIRYIADHPDEARAMGRRGREVAERLFNDEKCGEEVAALIKDVLR